MRKTLPVLLILLFTYSIILAQTENKNLSESNSKTTNVAQQIDYSESVPYKPREFKVEQKSKAKKEKKSKKDVEEGNQTVSPTDAARNQTSSDLVVAKSAPIMIPVSIFDAKGNIVQNLKKSDFKIFVDEQEQEISEFGVYDQPLNLVVILDMSPSTSYDIEEIRKYVTIVVGQLRPQDKVMIATFDSRTRILVDFTDDRQQINQAIKKAKFGDGTSLYETVKYSLRERISQTNGRKLIVLLTDGVDTTSVKATFEDSLFEAEKTDALFFPVYLDTYQNARKLMGNGQTVVTGRSVGDSILLQQILSQIPRSRNISANRKPMSIEDKYVLGRRYLADLALLSGGRAVTIQNLSNVNKSGFENVFEAFRNQFYIGVSSSGGGKIGQRKQVKVRINRPNLTVKARGSYIVGGNNQTLRVNSK